MIKDSMREGFNEVRKECEKEGMHEWNYKKHQRCDIMVTEKPIRKQSTIGAAL